MRFLPAVWRKTILLSFFYFHWLFSQSARETSPGNPSIYKSTRERVDFKGLYRRWRLHLMGSLLSELIYPLSCFVKNVNCFLFSRFTTSPSSFQPLSSYSFAGYQPRFPPPSSAPPIPPSLSSLNSPLSQYAPPSVSSPVTAMSHSPANAQVSLIFLFFVSLLFWSTFSSSRKVRNSWRGRSAEFNFW